jgi:uncharacterized protein (DUF697 family)
MYTPRRLVEPLQTAWEVGVRVAARIHCDESGAGGATAAHVVAGQTPAVADGACRVYSACSVCEA